MSGGSSYGSCCYADCTNSYSTNSNSIYFKFPNDDARRKKWIANCGNPEVAQLSDRHLRGKRICALHFPDSSFADSSKKENLTDKAVPNKYVKGKPAPVEQEVADTPSKRQRGRQSLKPPELQPETPTPVKSRRTSATPQQVQITAEDDKSISRRKAQTGSCSYADCTNTSANSSVVLFAFPADEARKKKWITNCGNVDVAQLTERSLKAKRVCADHFADSSFTDPAKKDELTEKAVPVKYTKPKQVPSEPEPEETEPVKKAESPQRTQSPTRAESPKRGGRGGRQPAKPTEIPAKPAALEVKAKAGSEAVTASVQRSTVTKVQSTFGKSLYTLLNGLLYDDEPSIKREKRTFAKSAEVGIVPMVESRGQIRLPNGRTIKAEVIEPRSEKVPRLQNLQRISTIRPVGQGKSHNRMLEQFVNVGGGGESGGLIIQNGTEFTLAEGQEYEVIGESDAHDQIQVVESENNEIEIIEVDDQTMAQLTAQNMFFPNSGNIQVTELDPNMGQILKVINPSEAYFHQYQ